MARGGFLGRVGRALRKILPPAPHPRHAPPPREPPPREPPPPSKNDFKQAWRDNRGGGNYKKNLALFHRLVDPIARDADEQLDLWESYIKHMTRGRERRNSTSNMFWRDTGIDPSDWDWAAWRQAMEYTGKRRSRTP